MQDIEIESYTSLTFSQNLQRNGRFQLPLDVKKLEEMTPSEYLCRYSVVLLRREALYQTVFKKHKSNENVIPFRRFELAINDVSICAVGHDDIAMLLEVSQIKEGTDFSESLFRGICALADRPEDEKLLDQKEGVEKADFHSLKFKLKDINISSNLKLLLEKL